jgi:hypothetical protein
MAVARFLILASIAVALVAAQNTLSCNGVTAPSSNMNYFVPPTDCRASDANIEACYTQWGQCTGNATDCNGINTCVKSVIVCLDNIPAPAAPNASSPCSAWNESFANVKMYLDMGGAYSGSALQAACNYAACTYVPSVAKASINNGTACPIQADVCSAAPKAPPKFVLTFAGDWVALLRDKPEAIKGALQRGIAKLLQIAEYAIRILSFMSGSLVVEFAVLDPSVDGNAVATALGRASTDASVLASAFSELAAESGLTLQLTNVAVGPGPSDITLAPGTNTGGTPAPGTTPSPAGTTPTPSTPAPASGASAVSAVAAVALVALSLLF